MRACRRTCAVAVILPRVTVLDFCAVPGLNWSSCTALGLLPPLGSGMDWTTFVNRVEVDGHRSHVRMPIYVQQFLRRLMAAEVDDTGRIPHFGHVCQPSSRCSVPSSGPRDQSCSISRGSGSVGVRGRPPDSTFVEEPYAFRDESEYDVISATHGYAADSVARTAMIDSLGLFLLEHVVRPSRFCRRCVHGYVRGRGLWPENFAVDGRHSRRRRRDLVVALRERMQLDRQQIVMQSFQRQMWHHRMGLEPNTLFSRPVSVRDERGIPDDVVSDAECERREYSRSHAGVVNNFAVDAGLAGSPFGLLHARHLLALVVDFVSEDDALCLALACRALRDTVWARFRVGVLNVFVIGHGIPPRDVWILDHPKVESVVRIRTRDAAILFYPSRIGWALGLSGAAWPLGGAGAAIDGADHALEHCRLCALLERRNRTERDAPDWRAWKMIAVAAGVGALDGVRRLRELGYGWNSVALHAAAGGGHLDVVVYLHLAAVGRCATHVQRPDGSLQRVCGPTSGDSCLAWGRITTAAAAAGGHLTVLEYLIDVVGCPWDACCAYLSSYYGHLDVLVWLEGRWNDFGRYSFESGVCDFGSWSDQFGGWEDPRYCSLPRRRRYTPALHGDRGNQMVCAAAALGGHLSVLQWARGTEMKFNRRSFAWNRDYCLSFASLPTGQGCGWFGADRPGFDRELCDHAVHAAYTDHHESSAIVRWIERQPAVLPGEDFAVHGFSCDEPDVYRCVSLSVCVLASPW